MMQPMWKALVVLLTVMGTCGCGYKVVSWSSEANSTITIPPVDGAVPGEEMKVRLRDALIERCLAGSGLRPVDRGGQLTLACTLADYSEQVIATDVDGRTKRLQFNMLVSFRLKDAAGNRVWSLDNYRYSDQYSITTDQNTYRDEAVFVQDDAMRSIADLVVTNLTLAIAELEQADE